MEYNFYGWQTADAASVNDEFPFSSPRELYDKLSDVWCEYTCCPRLRDKWTKENKTLGQCSITAFLAQEIFGGLVLGIATESGVHCFNVVGGVAFDLTSEQFSRRLSYENAVEQSRDRHFGSKEKYERYLYLKKKLKETL